MELKRIVAPFDASEALEHLEKIFGIEERLLEERQLNGSETEFNTDIVYLAYEDNTLLGMIHATIPVKTPYLAGLSAMFTTEAARGKGLGKVLFEKIVNEVSDQGASLTVLGTSNPVAAKLYSKFGFEFATGSNVMVRFSEGNMVDFAKDYYSEVSGDIKVSIGNPSIRIPIVPLVLQRDFGLILDINTKIFNTDTITERSCMGLFPRYEELRKCGGEYYMAFDEKGTLGAVASVLPQKNGPCRADFFALKSFESVVPDMIERIENAFGNIYIEIAKTDNVKERILKENGFSPVGDGVLDSGEFMIKTVKYER